MHRTRKWLIIACRVSIHITISYLVCSGIANNFDDWVIDNKTDPSNFCCFTAVTLITLTIIFPLQLFHTCMIYVNSSVWLWYYCDLPLTIRYRGKLASGRLSINNMITIGKRPWATYRPYELPNIGLIDMLERTNDTNVIIKMKDRH